MLPGIRLEVLPDEKLGNKSLYRGNYGNFVMNGFEVEAEAAAAHRGG